MPHNHHQILHFLHNRELNELYVSIAIRSFALSMIFIFIPIYLLQLDYSLSIVLTFFAVLAGVHAIGTFPAAKIASKYGFKHSIFYSVPFLIVAYLGLHSIDVFPWLFYIVAILIGISNAFFWTGFHVDFAKFSDKKHRGSEVGLSGVIGALVHAVGPIVGGFILVLFGFKILFIFVSILLFISVFPLFFSRDIHNSINFSIKGVFRGQKIKDGLALLGFGFEHAVGIVIWPIFIFFSILGEQYTSLGFVTSLSLVFASIFMIFIGKVSDKYRHVVLKIGAIANAIIWIIKSFIRTTLQVYIVDMFYGVTKTSVNIPFGALSYDKANKSDIVKFTVYREFMINAGRTIFFIVMIFIADITSSFIFGGSVGSLLQLLF